jgi:hypothetical protein
VPQDFEIVGNIEVVETIATGNAIREIAGLIDEFGAGRWRKLKGVALVRLPDDSMRLAELHWYEAHGIGKRRIKIKRYLD